MLEKNLSKIDHVVVMVADLHSSVEWYKTSFGCEVLHLGKTNAIIGFDNLKVVLSLPSDQRPHLGIMHPEAEKFGEVTEQSDLCFSTFIADPSGNPVELVKTAFCPEK